jgi:hypothetical protein
MSAPVNVNAQRAAQAWDSPSEIVPDWVAVLADECDRTSQREVAKRVGYSASVIAQVITRTYAGSYPAVEARVRGALMGEEVECPVLGAVRKDRCMEEQRKGHTGSSAIRTRLYHACRGGCVHSRIKGGARGD